MLHVMSVLCVARDLHTVAPGPLERRVGDSSRRNEEIVKKSRFAPLKAIIINMVVCRVRSPSVSIPVHCCLLFSWEGRRREGGGGGGRGKDIHTFPSQRELSMPQGSEKQSLCP